MTDLADVHDELRAVARDLLTTSAGAPLDWAHLVDVGWVGLEVSERLDGSGATFAESAVVIEEMGRVTASGPFIGTSVLGVGALRSVATTDVSDELLRRIAAGRVRVALALTPGGDDVRAEPPFEVHSTGGGHRLTGGAEFVLDATDADQLLLVSRTPDGGTAVVVVDATAVDVVDTPLLDATRRFATVVANGAALDPSSILRFEGDPTEAHQRLVDRAAVAIACDSLGLGAAMADATVAYVGARNQFDRPIGSFQAVKHACADMAVQLAVGRELLDAAVSAVAAGDPDADIAASRAKSFVGEVAVEVVGKAMQLHGGIGYTWESGVHAYLKRAVLNRSLVGSPLAHRRRIAAGIAFPS